MKNILEHDLESIIESLEESALLHERTALDNKKSAQNLREMLNKIRDEKTTI